MELEEFLVVDGGDVSGEPRVVVVEVVDHRIDSRGALDFVEGGKAVEGAGIIAEHFDVDAAGILLGGDGSGQDDTVAVVVHLGVEVDVRNSSLDANFKLFQIDRHVVSPWVWPKHRFERAKKPLKKNMIFACMRNLVE